MANLCGLKFEKGGKKLVFYVVKMLNRWHDRMCQTKPKKTFLECVEPVGIFQDFKKVKLSEFKIRDIGHVAGLLS